MKGSADDVVATACAPVSIEAVTAVSGRIAVTIIVPIGAVSMVFEVKLKLLSQFPSATNLVVLLLLS